MYCISMNPRLARLKRELKQLRGDPGTAKATRVWPKDFAEPLKVGQVAPISVAKVVQVIDDRNVLVEIGIATNKVGSVATPYGSNAGSSALSSDRPRDNARRIRRGSSSGSGGGSDES